MFYLWITSIAMVVGGVVLVAGKIAGVLDPIALVCGILLLWSGIVKVVLLRIWRASVGSSAPDSPNATTRAPAAKTFFGR